jgi:hypothetical protein
VGVEIMKAYFLSILHIVAGFTILLLGFYLLVPVIETLFSAGLTVQALALVVALVLIPLVYIAMGLALWIKPESTLLITLGAHVVIGVLTLLQLPRAISIYYKLSETPALSYLGLLLLIPLVKLFLAIFTIPYILVKYKPEAVFTLKPKPVILLSVIVLGLVGFSAVATASLADTPPVITERPTVYQHIRPFTDNNSAVVCYHLNHVGVNVTKLSERVQLELGVSVEIYAEISPENLTTRLCVVLPKDIVSNRGILLALNETITRHRDLEAELFHLGLIRSRIEAELPKACRYVYTWKGTMPSIDDMKRISTRVEEALKLPAPFEFSPDLQTVTFTFPRKLASEEKTLLDKVMESEGSRFLREECMDRSSLISPLNTSSSTQGTITAYSTRLYVLSPGLYTTNYISWLQVDLLVDYVFIWSAETFNTGGRTDYYVYMDNSPTPIPIGWCGRDPYPEFWVRTLHGSRGLVSVGSHNSNVYIYVNAGTTHIWYVVYTIQPVPVISLLDVIGLAIGIVPLPFA